VSGLTELAEKITTSRIYQKRSFDIAAYIMKLLQLSKDINNPVYKLIADKLQLVLINVLIRSRFEH